MKKKWYFVMLLLVMAICSTACEMEDLESVEVETVQVEEEELQVDIENEVTEEATETLVEEMSEEENLTIENCPDLADILANKAEIDESYAVFASTYEGRVVEFEGRIDYCTKHEDYDTRFDYLVSAGDYDENSQIGPVFKFENVSYYDLNTDLDTVSVGLNVYIVAEVVSFDNESGLFYLDPVSVTGR